ncbi:hypothetical protein M409DRAFT_21495 [Zasmidium cellare ATCC 36951]|uniref:Ecp2 effector protein domain-containing protein n=1 Tax=Zasmidium cellare ATCC 36951 TaxID=1080233 RepID=A0A6A6CQJ7_ZASCE|nr:uncharacterized protein M409DRAFT_21495 [Zasmidium cellare ATCC 36951]KAF2168049.1 hypothetical protein M409DRAFT_21495 [Zasmidium cellare ATCC 36951]
MLFRSIFFLLAGLHLAAVLDASPITVDNSDCVEQTLFCYQSGQTTTQKIIDGAVDNLCKKYDGLDLGGRLQAAPDFYISPTGHHIGAEVSRPGPVVPDCDYNITYNACKRWLPKPFNDCPTHQGGNVTEDRCGLMWLIDPDVLGGQDLSNATTTKKDCKDPKATTLPTSSSNVISAEGLGNFTWGVPGSKISLKHPRDLSYMGDWDQDGCYDSGYQRTTSDLMQAATSFCNYFNFQTVNPGWYLTMTYHMCYDDHLDHNWLTLQVQEGSEPLCLVFAQCMIMMEDFIKKTCDVEDGGDKQGGWALNDHGYMIIDGDPKLHDNEKQTQADLDCADDEQLKALITAHPPQRDHPHDDFECPSH